jgi:hypothetical protein
MKSENQFGQLGRGRYSRIPFASGAWDDAWVVHMNAAIAQPGLGEILGKALAMSLQCRSNVIVGGNQHNSRYFFGLQRGINVNEVWPKRDRARFRSQWANHARGGSRPLFSTLRRNGIRRRSVIRYSCASSLEAG